MLKLHIVLKCKEAHNSYKVGGLCELYNDVFDQNCGLAYHPLDKNGN